MAKKEDLKGKTPDELREALVNLRKERFNLRFQRASGQLENTARVRKVRRDIARVMTALAASSKKTAA
jgi:large subunit ribosomal protein L29